MSDGEKLKKLVLHLEFNIGVKEKRHFLCPTLGATFFSAKVQPNIKCFTFDTLAEIVVLSQGMFKIKRIY